MGIYILLVVQVVMCGHDGFLRFTARSPEGIGLGWFFVPVIGGIGEQYFCPRYPWDF